MNNEKVKSLLDSVIKLSETIDELDSSIPKDMVAYNKAKRCFIALMEMELHSPEDLEVYEFNGENFEVVTK